MPVLSTARSLIIGSLLAATAACSSVSEIEAAPPAALPVMAWDHTPDASEWTEAALDALRSDGVALLSEVPGDIGHWCPGYASAREDDRAAFWAGLISALARYESTWNEEAVGGGGQWYGLVQISPATARGYGCDATTGSALREGEANLQCAIRIAASTVARDGVVAAGGGGFAADWGPFANGNKRAAMAAWVSQQDYCQA